MTTLDMKNEANYAPQVVRVHSLVELPGLDNLRAFPVGGYQALVSKDTLPGTLMVVFPAECQLSGVWAARLNLHRHSELNDDPSVAGYLEDSRRVKAIKLRGHNSNALAINASAFGLDDSHEGAIFDHIDGVEVSRKYLVKVPQTNNAAKSQQEKAWKRVDTKFLPEHIDTENYWRNKHLIPQDAHVTVTQKVHGTSIRLANTIVQRRLTWLERLAVRLGVKVATTEYDYVFGSRKVIKDPNNPNQDHYYDYDLWSQEGAKYQHLIPKNVILYGELIGWTGANSPIQSNYTYNVPNGEAHLYIYRVAIVTEDGGLYDLSWEGVKAFCASRGLNVVPELWDGPHYMFIPENWIDVAFYPEYPHAVPLSDKKSVDEGVVIRVEGVIPFVTKAKSPIFLGHESSLLDKETVDIESTG